MRHFQAPQEGRGGTGTSKISGVLLSAEYLVAAFGHRDAFTEFQFPSSRLCTKPALWGELLGLTGWQYMKEVFLLAGSSRAAQPSYKIGLVRVT